MTLDEQILSILRDNIAFSGQVGDYVVHGAVEKIKELIKEYSDMSWDASNSYALDVKRYCKSYFTHNKITAPNKKQYLLSIFNQ